MSDQSLDAAELGAKGGKARAKRLTPEQRSEQARQAVEARWEKVGMTGEPVVAPLAGVIKIGDLEIKCCVLDDGTRVLHERGIMKALGVVRSGRLINSDGGAQLPLFVGEKALIPFMDQDLAEVLKKPIWYLPPSGPNSGRPHKGIRAETLPKVCHLWLRARDAGALDGKKAQLVVAANADIISRGLAEVGIVALVDEATGYEDMRPRLALAKILEQFVAKEIQPYLSTFPVDWFRELCRLKSIPFRDDMRLPPYVGRLVNSLVYCRLAPGVLAELQRKNPVLENGRRKGKNYKWLTPQVGHPKLVLLLGSEVTLMRMSATWNEFKKLVDRFHEPYKHLPLLDWAERENTTES